MKNWENIQTDNTTKRTGILGGVNNSIVFNESNALQVNKFERF